MTKDQILPCRLSALHSPHLLRGECLLLRAVKYYQRSSKPFHAKDFLFLTAAGKRKDGFEIRPTINLHEPAMARRSQARAKAQRRSAVRGDISRDWAASGMDNPAK